MDPTVVDGRSSRSRRPWTSARWLTVMAVLIGGCGTPSTLKRVDEALPHRTFVVREITAERGAAFLSDLGLGEVTPGSEPNSLVAEGTVEELEKAGIALEIADVADRYVIQQVASAATVRTLPSNDQIAGMIDGVTIGTFAAPPERGRGARAIIDMCNGSVLAIAPARLWPDIRAVIEFGGKAIRQRRAEAPKSEPNGVSMSTVSRKEPEDSGSPGDKRPRSDDARKPPRENLAGVASTREPPRSDVALAPAERPKQAEPKPAAGDCEGSPRESPSPNEVVGPTGTAVGTRTQADRRARYGFSGTPTERPEPFLDRARVRCRFCSTRATTSSPCLCRRRSTWFN